MSRLRAIAGRLLLWSAGVALAAGIVVLILVAAVAAGFDGTAETPSADCGMVFGAAVRSAANPGPGILRRVAAAAELYKAGNIRYLYLSGGKGSPSQESEARVMRKVALLHGIDPDHVTLEEQSGSTWENLQFTRPMTTGSCSTVLGISDRYHLARISYLAGLQGWKELHTSPAEGSGSWRFELRSVLREALGIGYYFVFKDVPARLGFMSSADDVK